MIRRAHKPRHKRTAPGPQAATASYDDTNRLIQRSATTYASTPQRQRFRKRTEQDNNNLHVDSRNRPQRYGVERSGSTLQRDFAGNHIHQADSGPLTNASRSFVLDSLTNVAFGRTAMGIKYLSCPAGRLILIWRHWLWRSDWLVSLTLSTAR